MSIKRTIEIPDDATFSDLYNVTAREWYEMPPLSQCQYSDLKYESQRYRVWQSRMTLADYDGNAQAYTDERIMFEQLIGGRWVMLDRYGKVRS